MTYLQCETKDTTHHSFVYFRLGGDWKFVGTGFDMDEKSMTKDVLNSKIHMAGAQTVCKKASVAFNVYGGPLEECRLPSDEEGGSWMDDGKCSETSGGIHQICIQAGTLPHDFSMNTYQTSDWSESRTHSSHCICVGAWSTYMTEESKHQAATQKITPRCKSIPETVLTKEYMANWKNWNGFSANVGKGLAELISRCLRIDAKKAKCGLKKRFLKLNSDEPEIEKASELDSVREELAKLHCS